MHLLLLVTCVLASLTVVQPLSVPSNSFSSASINNNHDNNPMNIETAREYLDLYDTILNASPHSRSPSTFLSTSSADELSLPLLRTCVTYLSNLSTRTQLGICSNTPQEGINTLKRWTEELELRKGLLIGLDENGVAVDTRKWSGIYIKYSTGGAATFSQLRSLNRGFLGLHKPGDALCESYDGEWRGVYFSVELEGLEDGWRQWGVLPEGLFDDLV
ncbi:hypothetical protein TrLO_g13324 [Triparma laevis f. longispina]|uniref:Uncharacterized protein n=1 Tax=Triparma laevis f. longispina TaxID=1714387 RepID=A0A9W7FVL8_9STRA|nr:hypothetical protein TrLO_g13324 [Triparma laevis f. longispina]